MGGLSSAFALLNRTRHWADVESVLEAGAIDPVATLDQVRTLLGASDLATVRLAELIA